MQLHRLRVSVLATLLISTAALLSMGPACSGVYEPDEHSGRDGARTGAQEIPLETSVTDAVNRNSGDSTDWKSFVLDEPGTVTVEIFWDTPYIPGGFSLHDQYGQMLESVPHQDGVQAERIVSRVQEAGIYYIKVYLTDFSSSYSLRVWPWEYVEGESSRTVPRPELGDSL